MSYDLTIRADDRYSQFTAIQPLIEIAAELPNVEMNGERGLVLDDPPSRWMEIDLETVSEEGDFLEEEANSLQINCVSLHVPYAFYRSETFETDYLPTALAIARHLQWSLIDPQTENVVWSPGGEVVWSPGPDIARLLGAKRPWWRFW